MNAPGCHPPLGPRLRGDDTSAVIPANAGIQRVGIIAACGSPVVNASGCHPPLGPRLRGDDISAVIPANAGIQRFGAIAARALISACLLMTGAASAQVRPSPAELAAYTGLHAAAAKGDAAEIRRLAASGANAEARDRHGRTPFHVAAHQSKIEAMRALVAAGANPNALESDRYDAVTIASVANDLPALRAALALGNSAKNITSRYDGTALIAAAHLGHAEVVRELIRAGAPLDHVNNLGWTALIESIVLGDGGPRHTDTLRALVEAGANVNIADRQGRSPLALARERGYRAMISILERAGAR